MNPRSLRFQLIAWYVAVLTGTLLLFGASIYLGVRFLLERNLGDTQVRRAQQIAETLVTRIPEIGSAKLIEDIRVLYAPEHTGRFIRVVRDNGDLVYMSGRASDSTFDPSGMPLAPRPWQHNSSRREVLPGGSELVIGAVTVTPAGSGVHLVEVGAPFGPTATLLNHLLVSLAVGLPLMMCMAVCGGYVLVGRALAPVVKIADSAERISAFSPSERLPLANTGDELERLTTTVNHMIERLNGALESNRRFLLDASHELRTPLTAMRGELEMLVQHGSLTQEDRSKVGSALEEADRLIKIVEALFTISRVDAGEPRGEWVTFDLARLASGVADNLILLAEDRGIELRFESNGAVEVMGDPSRIKQVVVNLLDNAIKYTADGGLVRLIVGAARGLAILEVVDTGIGIPSGAIPQVFERFYRVDDARSRGEGGAGIGLSIVKSICVAHGGQVEVTSVAGRGSRFRVTLPLAGPQAAPANKTESSWNT